MMKERVLSLFGLLFLNSSQIFSMLGSVFSNDSASAFAIFKFVQSLSAAVAFFYSNLLSLYIQV